MKQKGFITQLLLIIIALALLKYLFDWSIFDAISSEKGRGTINYIKDVVSVGWEYVKIAYTFVWQKVAEFLPSR